MHIVRGDLTSLTQLQEAAQKVASVTGGSLDVLINNGAYLDVETPALLPTALSAPENVEKVHKAFHKGVDTNVLGAIHVTNTFLPLILKGTQKKIVHISTAMGDTAWVTKAGVWGGLTYSATKAMLNLVVAKFAVELEGQGVLIFSLSPGWVDTDDFERKYYLDLLSLIRVLRNGVVKNSGLRREKADVGNIQQRQKRRRPRGICSACSRNTILRSRDVSRQRSV